MEKSILYADKPSDYFSNIREDIISVIPDGPHRILDVGCGNGGTLIKLKELGKAKEIYGIELNAKCIESPSKTIDGLYLGDIETSAIPFHNLKFDVIIFADILEHLIDPYRVLAMYKSLLSERGWIIASIPNIKYFSVLLNLIFLDKFEYVPQRILDRSHLRFFTKKEIFKMFDKSHLQVIRCYHNLVSPLSYIDKKFDNLLSRHIPGMSFFTVQYVVVAKHKPRIELFPSQNM